MKPVDRVSPPLIRLPKRMALFASLIGISGTCLSCDFDATKVYRISVADLGQTLLMIGRTSGCTIVFEPRNTDNFRGPFINGKLSAREAMVRALKDTNLETLQTRNGTLTVREQGIYSAAER